jgi:hypothetical protein
MFNVRELAEACFKDRVLGCLKGPENIPEKVNPVGLQTEI